MKRIILCGVNGKMGKAICDYLKDKIDYKIVCGVARMNTVINKIVVYNNLQTALDNFDCDIIIDFTIAEVALKNIEIAINNNKPIVVGTTGLTDENITYINSINHNKIPVLIVPNFSIGAILLSTFASVVSKYFNDADIVEKHHIKKKDVPSGTAKYLQQVIENKNCLCNTNITSYRIGDVVAEHELIFSSDSEQISLKHASYDRTSFMFGIKYCIDNINNYSGVHFGIENIIKL